MFLDPGMFCHAALGEAVQKVRWAVMFTCLCTRAVHLEILESMSSSSFINALRSFLCLRGPVKNSDLTEA